MRWEIEPEPIFETKKQPETNTGRQDDDGGRVFGLAGRTQFSRH
jgi:hypothetical protein